MNYLIDTSSIYLNVRLKALGSVIPLWLISFVHALLSHTSKRKDLREKSKVCSHGNADNKSSEYVIDKSLQHASEFSFCVETFDFALCLTK
jgi:hypothetical protein